MSMDNQQQNPNLLEIRTRYETGESLNKLSQEYGINIGSLRYKLSRLGVRIRNISEGVCRAVQKPTLVLSDYFKDLLVGLIMGDGSLRKLGNNPYFVYTDKHIEVIEYIVPFFISEGIKCSEIICNNHTGAYSFQTEVREEFLYYYNLFYPEDIMKTQKQFRKILPSINLNSTIMLWWYLGDGSSSKQSKSLNHKGQISCKHFNESILRQLRDLFGGQCSYYPYKSGGAYYLGSKGLISLLEYIGECPVPCYKYKWITRCSETTIEES